MIVSLLSQLFYSGSLNPLLMIQMMGVECLATATNLLVVVLRCGKSSWNLLGSCGQGRGSSTDSFIMISAAVVLILFI